MSTSKALRSGLMTTNRPDRAALTGAGSQLDERRVGAVNARIETDVRPPLPGRDVAPGRLWTPARAVA